MGGARIWPTRVDANEILLARWCQRAWHQLRDWNGRSALAVNFVSRASNYNRLHFPFKGSRGEKRSSPRPGAHPDGNANGRFLESPRRLVELRESLLCGRSTREERDTVKIKQWKWCMRLQSGSHAIRRSQAVLLKAVLMKSAVESQPDLIDSGGNKSRLSWQICDSFVS